MCVFMHFMNMDKCLFSCKMLFFLISLSSLTLFSSAKDTKVDLISHLGTSSTQCIPVGVEVLANGYVIVGCNSNHTSATTTPFPSCTEQNLTDAQSSSSYSQLTCV